MRVTLPPSAITCGGHHRRAPAHPFQKQPWKEIPMSRTIPATLACLLLSAILASAQTTANCTFTFFQGTQSRDDRTLPDGINRYGNVVGSIIDPGGTRAMIRYSNGSVKLLQAPNATGTWFHRRNANGVTVGAFADSNGKVHGVVYANGSWRAVDYPGALRTELMGINMYGTIVGFYLGTDNN